MYLQVIIRYLFWYFVPFILDTSSEWYKLLQDKQFNLYTKNNFDIIKYYDIMLTLENKVILMNKKYETSK